MDQTVRINATQLGGDPNRTQMGAAPGQTVMGGPPIIGGQGGNSLSLSVRVGNGLAAAGERTRAHVMTQITANSPIIGGQGGNFRRLPVNVAFWWITV